MSEQNKDRLHIEGIDPTTWEGTLEMLHRISATGRTGVASPDNKHLIEDLIASEKQNKSFPVETEPININWEAARENLIDLKLKDPTNPLCSEANFQILDELIKKKP